MTTITAPAPVAAPQQMSAAARRECALVRKRFNTPQCFTPDDQVELERLQLLASETSTAQQPTP